MVFLVGTSLRNNLFNLGLEAEFRKALADAGFDIDEIYAIDPDAGLGNGGLGRLASCYMDAATGMDYPMTGFSIRYEFGIFKQKIVDGWQMEFPDNWLEMGDVWLQAREDDAVEVKFGGEVREWMDNDRFKVAQVGYSSVMAVPYDMYISGYDSDAANRLVLWSAKLPQSFDMAAFSRGDYVRALERNAMAETISKVLYPADDHIQGKRLRLKQQYLLVSASLQSILKKHYKKYRTYTNLPEKVAIHINDTHPALCVPELMRLLIDEHDFGWDEAWDITCRTLSYTNHTVMSEALERWNVDLFREQLPRVYSICQEINRRLIEHLCAVYPNDWGKINYMAVIANNEVRMANLCLAACHKVNGVSKLHTDILRNGIFRDYCQITPERFLNVTNGIAYRRWLCQSDPLLTDYLKQLIGGDFLRDARALEKLLPYQNDEKVLADLMAIKRKNKERLAALIENQNGVRVDPDSIFDIQIKRLHEYKRQLLNILHVLYLYRQIKANPHGDFMPRTFIFAAKASAGYIRAKQIISLIVAASKLINNDPDVNDKLKVVFLEDYKVSLAEIIIPAADISEQISIAGKEAAADASRPDGEVARIERSACPGCGSCSGMFTANSMNCLTEALGLALPGNGTLLATHANRRRLFETAAELIVRNAARYYDEGDETVLPRSIATKAAFENAMSLDIAMGGSTNTVLHLLAAAHEAGVDFTMHDIDRLSRRVPVLCKVAPNSHYHIQDVNRAGGIFALLGELDRAGLLDTSVRRVEGRTLAEAIAAEDILSARATEEARRRALSAPAGLHGRELGMQHSTYDSADTDRTAGCIRDAAHAYFRDGGLAVLTGNIARGGCVVKTAGVDPSLFRFRGPARVYESQEQAVEGILGGEVQAGDVVVIRYEGPRGGPGMQEMLYPTSYLKSRHLDKACALLTDGRFSGGTSGLSIGHVSPEAAAGGEIAVIRTGDPIEIDIPARTIRLAIGDDELAARTTAQRTFVPAARDRTVPASLRAYARLVSSADRGAVRLLDDETR